MGWPVLATISVITLSVSTLLGRTLMKEEDSNPYLFSIVFQFGLTFFCLVFALIFNKLTVPHVQFIFPRFGLSAFLWAGATLFSIKAIKTLNAGEATILGSASSVVSIFLGIIFLKEVLSLPVIIGIILIFISILIVNTEKLSFKSREGIKLALISSVCAGIAVVNDASILKTYEAFSYTTIMSLLPGMILLVLYPKEITKIKTIANKKTILLTGSLCFLYAIQAITYYLAFQKGAPVSQISPFTKSTIVLTVILAAIFLKERSNLPKKILASIVVTVGAILLS